MRPTLSELGEYDGTALMEFKTKKNVHYLINKNSSCTYEMDDTPPFPVNQQGLDISIELALMLNCQVVDEFHIIRKQYLDGSIPAGFQRTGIVGAEGWIMVDGKEDRHHTTWLRRRLLPRGQGRKTRNLLPHRPAKHAAHRDSHLS